MRLYPWIFSIYHTLVNNLKGCISFIFMVFFIFMDPVNQVFLLWFFVTKAFIITVQYLHNSRHYQIIFCVCRQSQSKGVKILHILWNKKKRKYTGTYPKILNIWKYVKSQYQTYETSVEPALPECFSMVVAVFVSNLEGGFLRASTYFSVTSIKGVCYSVLSLQ